MNNIKEGAIDALVEKEKIIIDLQEKNQTLDEEINNQRDNYFNEIKNLQEKLYKNSFFNEFEDIKKENVILRQKLSDLTKEMESKNEEFEKIIQNCQENYDKKVKYLKIL